MTIEIRQLVIRAVVDARAPTDASEVAPVSAPLTTRPRSAESTPAPAASDRDALVAACVRAVLRELQRSSQR